VRYKLAKSNPGNIIFNWLFIPGGPGADSSYFLDLINNLDIPGNLWLIDFPGNGSNISDHVPADFNFDSWDEYLISTIKRFENPIIVGHSFGGMFPLLFPQLEQLLKGFVILNSPPSLWLEEAAKCAKENNIPLVVEPLAEFERNPNPETWKTALLACAPYYFPENTLEIGKKLIEQMPFNYLAAVWWLKKVNEINFTAKWIPQNVPTLILGASHDFMAPYSLYERDKRFDRENITMKKIKNAGHFPWIEQMNIVKSEFKSFADKIQI
jgi:pimeloyl-ACP methyl ester carboxylesterase